MEILGSLGWDGLGRGMAFWRDMIPICLLLLLGYESRGGQDVAGIVVKLAVGMRCYAVSHSASELKHLGPLLSYICWSQAKI
jgi:hypothetical protein